MIQQIRCWEKIRGSWSHKNTASLVLKLFSKGQASWAPQQSVCFFWAAVWVASACISALRISELELATVWAFCCELATVWVIQPAFVFVFSMLATEVWIFRNKTEKQLSTISDLPHHKRLCLECVCYGIEMGLVCLKTQCVSMISNSHVEKLNIF